LEGINKCDMVRLVPEGVLQANKNGCRGLERKQNNMSRSSTKKKSNKPAKTASEGF